MANVYIKNGILYTETIARDLLEAFTSDCQFIQREKYQIKEYLISFKTNYNILEPHQIIQEYTYNLPYETSPETFTIDDNTYTCENRIYSLTPIENRTIK